MRTQRLQSHGYYRFSNQNGSSLSFTFNGEKIEAQEGDTLISALYAHGKRIFTRSFKYHRPRGFYDYYGYGAELMLTVDGKPNMLGGKVLAKNGMVVITQNAWPSPDFDIMSINKVMVPLLPNGFYYKMFHKPKGVWPFFEKIIRKAAGLGKINTSDNHEQERNEKVYLFPDVCIVGGGPAGLGAAESALKTGKKVVLIDENPQLGGHATHTAFKVENCKNKALNGKTELEAVEILIAALRENSDLTILTETTAFGVYEDNLVAAIQDNNFYKIRTDSVVIAAGVTDRHLTFENNDMPGVVTARSIERLIALHGIKPAQDAVVVTCHEGGYHSAIMLKEAGVNVKAVLDARPSGGTGEFSQKVQAEGIKVITGQTIHSVSGGKTINVIKYGSLDGKQAGGRISCEMAVMAVGYKSTMNLLSMGNAQPRWNDEIGIFKVNALPVGMYAAGEVNGYGTFATIYEEGRKAGAAAASGKLAQASKRTDEEKIFILPPDIESGGTHHFVDKCMDVTRTEINKSVSEGFDQVETLKRYTSMGMGPGQGKYSYEAIARVTALETQVTNLGSIPTTVRPPFVPVSFAALAGRSHHLVPIRRTSIHGWHEAKGAKFLIAGQWKRPEDYGSVNQEVMHVRNELGMIDVGTLGKIELKGPDVVKFLHLMLPGKYAKMVPGKTRYSIMIGENGIMFEDGTISRLDDERYYISTTTGNQDAIYSRFSMWAMTEGVDIQIKNLSSSLAGISLAGPNSREFLQGLTDSDLSNEAFPYMTCLEAKISGVPAILFRIGFTGELGYELHFPAEYGKSFWEHLMETGEKFNIKPFGVEAQRILRLEKGHFIPGTDTDALTSPYDAGVGFTIKEDKEDFLGKAFLSNFKHKDFSKREKLVPYVLEAGVEIPDDGVAVLDSGKIAGRVTSSRYSPTVKKGIGLAWVKTPLAITGNKIQIRLSNGSDVFGEIIDHAVYDPKGERVKS